MTPPPNIVLITTDQQRYDTLGVNGNPIIATPHLDQLASCGANFHRAYVTNPVCVASRACLQTGRYTHQHGVEYMENVVDETPGLPPWEGTFMERLQVAGYHTAAFGKIHMYPPKGFHETKLSGGQGARWDKPYGLALGPSPLGNEYAAWLEARRPGAFAALHEQRSSRDYIANGSAVTSVLPLEESVDTWVLENSLDYLRRRDDQPFLLWTGFLNPHTPLDTPVPYDMRYHPDDIPVPPTYLADVSDRPSFYAERQRTFREQPDTARIRRMLAHYYGLCTMLDDHCGRLFAALKELGLWENTLVIFTSDHGDMLGDFGMTGKSNFMEGSIHVPLIVKAPAADPCAVRGLENTALVEMFDIAATALDYAGLPIPARMQAQSLRRALADAACGKEMVLCEYTSNDKRLKGKCLRTDRFKYIVWAPDRAEELYDMHADGLEIRNLAADPAYTDIMTEMRIRLIEHLMATEKPAMTWF